MTWIHEGHEWFIRCDHNDCGRTVGPGQPIAAWQFVYSAVADRTEHFCPTHKDSPR